MDKKNIVRKPRSKRNYINGVDFQNSLVTFSLTNDPESEIPRYIGECILQIASKLATKINFSGYSYREDMEWDAIEKMVEAVRLKKYDVNQSSNPLGYFSQIAWNSFLQRIAKEKQQADIKVKNYERISLTRDDIPAAPKSAKSLDFQNDLEVESFLNEGATTNVAKEDTSKKSYGYAKHSNLSYEKNRKKKKDVIILS